MQASDSGLLSLLCALRPSYPPHSKQDRLKNLPTTHYDLFGLSWAQDRPVFATAQLSLLKSLRHPTLLVFDRDDPGHPLASGRMMHARLPHSHLLIYSGRSDPYWHSDHFTDEFVTFLRSGSGVGR